MLESTRLLLNSGDRQFQRRDGSLPAWIRLRHVGGRLGARSARRQSVRRGLMGGSAFIPRFRNLKKEDKRDFIKGYCVHHQQRRRAQPQFLPAVRRGAAKEAR